MPKWVAVSKSHQDSQKKGKAQTKQLKTLASIYTFITTVKVLSKFGLRFGDRTTTD